SPQPLAKKAESRRGLSTREIYLLFFLACVGITFVSLAWNVSHQRGYTAGRRGWRSSGTGGWYGGGVCRGWGAGGRGGRRGRRRLVGGGWQLGRRRRERERVMAAHPAWARRFLSEPDFDVIAGAIRAAESRTSAEIRVHLERRVPRRLFRRRHDVLARARQVFRRLGMHRTADRHGVLIYVAVMERRLAVVGDEGIHARVGDLH